MKKLLESKRLDGSKGLLFYCPGCKMYHVYTVGEVSSGPSWQWNGDMEKPTFTPSLLVRTGDDRQCHLFVRDGMIQYLDDCYHELKGRAVEMEDEKE